MNIFKVTIQFLFQVCYPHFFFVLDAAPYVNISESLEINGALNVSYVSFGYIDIPLVRF